jgi:hypothetical protein
MSEPRIDESHPAVRKFGIVTGWALLTLMGMGFVLGGVLPPPGPYAAAVTADYFHQNVDVKRLGIILIITGGTMFLPFGAAIADRLRRVSGVGPIAALTEFGAAAIASALMMICGAMLLVGLLRPDMPDSTYQLLNHVTWMTWAGLWQPGALSAAATAWAILSDKSPIPVFPRWVGWYSLCMAFGSLTGSLIPFFTSGPFTWNGFISFWIAGAIFFAWYIILLLQLILIHRRANAREMRDDRPADDSSELTGAMEASAR